MIPYHCVETAACCLEDHIDWHFEVGPARLGLFEHEYKIEATTAVRVTLPGVPIVRVPIAVDPLLEKPIQILSSRG